MKKLYALRMLYLLMAFGFTFLHANSQIVINEICPSNISVLINSNGDYDDWIELHNSGSSSVNLSGYGLTDDPTKPYRFTFPSYTLPAGGKILVFASDSTSQVIVDHWEMPVDALTAWRYASGSASLDTNWRNLSFNQNAWSSGNGGIGFADSDDNTVISVGPSVMMRKTFSIPDTSQILKAVLMMDYDDGFVAYLNGVEIARSNLGTAGTRPLWNELANSSHEAQVYQGNQPDSFFIPPSQFKSLLRPGTNVFAVETHNTTATGSDLSSIPYLMFGMKTAGSTFSNIPSWFHPPLREYFNAHFKLSRTGETIYLTNPGGTVVDQKTFPSIEINNSLGRKPDGSSTWCYFSTPTPALSNNSSTCYSGYAIAPIFSRQGGYYSTSQTLSLTNTTPGGVIRYTTNGDVPTTSSPQYTSTISIPVTKTIRARVFASGYLPSPTITNSYFIGASTQLPTFSITTDSLNLWDYNTGIYVMGPNAEATYPYKGANFWQNWAKPASVEFFDRNKNLVSKFDADIEIYGNYSRAKPQKSFEIKLSDKYGLSSLNYPLFADKPWVDNSDNFILRNSGTDWNNVHFRDAFLERLMKNTYSGYLAATPAIAYLNGSYWGVYCMYENHDEHWMKNNYNLGKSEIDYLVEGSSMVVREGSDASFWNLYNYATVQSPLTTQYYNYVSTLLDLQNYADYFIAETFVNNGDWIGDWTNNIKLWRPNKQGGKWRYLLYDLDFGFGYSGSVNDNRLSIARNPSAFSHSSEMFDAILKNPTFKRYFINRYCDLMNTIFLPANMNNVMHSYKDSMANDMVNHFAKWGSNTSTWNSNINSMMTFANARPAKMKDFIKAEFGLGKIVTLTFAVSPANAGRIEVSTIIPSSYPWTGDYFKDNTVTITAIPNPGYTFDHWRSTGVINTNNYNQSVTYNFTGNETITAYFTGSSAPVNICVSELNYNADSALNSGDWIELKNYGSTSINLSGWRLSDGVDNHNYVFPTGTVIPAGGYLVLVEDTMKFKSQFPTVSCLGPIGFNFSNGGDQVRLFNHSGSVYLSFYYQDITPWPLGPDGGGYTLELTSNSANPNNPASWFQGCIGGSPGRAFSSALSSPVSVSGNTTFCTGQSVTLNATFVQGYTYQWKRNSAVISGATSSSLVASLDGSYTVVVSEQGCSSESAPTVVTVVAQHPQPQVTPAYRCGSGILTLGATSTDSVYWYDSNVGGNLLGSGDVFVTPNLSTTTTYYARTGLNCQSLSVPVSASVIPEAAVPVANNVTRCGPGTVTLNAVDTAVCRWYNQPTSGGLLFTGSSFVTNILDNDTSFFVEAGSVCPSPRIEVLVTISSSPSVSTGDTSRCGNGPLTLTASSTAPIFWYTSQYGGTSIGSGSTYTTSSLSASDTFYVEANSGCPSARERAIAIIFPIPPAPVINDTSICSPGSVLLTASATEQVKWYDAPSNGNLIYTGSIYTTPNLSSSATYYLSNGYYCPSPRIPVTVTVSSPAAPPVSSDVSRCGTGTVTLVASSPELIYWYNAPVGGTLLATSDVFVTPSIAATTTYYAEAGTFCRSLTRTAVKAIVDPAPVAPSANDVSRCGPGSVTLDAVTPDPVYWYTAPSGGTPIATGNSFQTASLSTTTTYYVESGTTCRSSRIPVQAIISNTPASPGVADVTRCGSGSVSLVANSSATVSWYASAAGGSPLWTGLTFNTPTLSSTTTYYAEANNGCSSARVPVQAIISAVPSAPVTSNVSRCGNGTVILTASSPEQIYWFTSPSGGSPVSTGTSYTTSSLSSTTTFYVETGDDCRSTRIPVQAIINAVPSSPSLTGASRCNPGSLTLTASSSSTVNWFTSSSGGSAVSTGLSYTTPVISSTTVYYAEASNGTCVSPRVSVQATINTAPSAPLTSDGNRCGPGTVLVSATGTGTINWYSSSSGGTSLGSGTNFTTPSISSTTIYYAEANNGCASVRTAVNAIINPVPAAPVTSDVNRCGPGSVTLTATSPEQIYWFTSSSGGSPVATGTSFTTPSLSATTTYYVETGDNCRSSRIPVQAIINASAQTPSVSPGFSCGPGTVVLTASSTAQVIWYSTSTGGTPLGTGLSFTTPFISASTTYYAEASFGGSCISTRVSVLASINSAPAAPVTTGGTRCGTGTVSLSASGAGTINWYLTPTGGVSLGSGANFTTPSISSTTTYYAQANDGCSSSRTATAAVVTPLPAAPATSAVSRCGPGSLTLSATSPEQIYWFTVSSGGSPVSTGTSFITPSITSTTTYYVETGNSCRSLRIPVQAIVNSIPSAPALTGSYHCGPGTVNLSATTSSVVSWYSSASGGTSLGTGLNFTTPFISATTTYYAEASNGSCVSTSRSSVVASINSGPSAPSANGGTRCGPGNVNLSASGTGTINWYLSSSGGSSLGSGSNFTTPSISVTTTYYAEANDGCPSSRTPASAVITPLPAAPVTADVSRCGSGQLTLTASSSEQIYWFTVPNGGTPVSTGSNFTTPTVTTTTTYYVETGNTCRSQRIPVQAIINNVPSTPSLNSASNCGPGTVTLTASSSSLVSWFSSAAGGTALDTGLSFTTPVLSATTVYYAEAGQQGCTSLRASVQAVILSQPAAPSVVAASNCGPGSLTLNATSSGQTYWYTSITGGNPIDSGTAFTTPVLNSTVIYYAGTSNGVCSSVRTAAVATIIPLPPAPVTADVSHCGPGSVTLAATSSEQIFWYNAPVGGALVATGSSFTTPSLNSSTTYYVETGNNCRSVRIPVQALIVSTPNPPALADSSRCGPGTVVLQAIAPVRVNWFSSPSGGTLLDTGLTFTTPFITTTTTYYAEAGFGCNSIRVPVTAHIESAPPPPSASNSTRCGAGTLNLSATSAQSIRWYDAPSGGNLLQAGNSFVTPVLNSTTTYYVEAGDVCQSTRIPVVAILGGSQVNTIFEAALCGSGSAVLSASAPQPVDSVSWYDSPGGNYLGSGQFFTTPYLNSTTTFYAVAHSSCTGLPVPVSAYVFNLPVVNLGPDTIIIPSGQSLTLDGGSGFVSYLWSTNETTSTIDVSAEGLYTLTVTDANGCNGTDQVFVDFYTSVNNLNGKDPLRVYPNPTHGDVTIVLPESSGNWFVLNLLSMEGKCVKSEIVNTFNRKTEKKISLTGIAAGIYILDVRSDEYSSTVKIHIQ